MTDLPSHLRLPVHPKLQQGRVLDARLDLFDRQVRDNDHVPVSCVTDLEISDWVPGEPAPTLANLIVGSGLWERLIRVRQPDARRYRIPWKDVSDVQSAITLGVSGDSLEVTWLRRWLGTHLIARLPGGRHAS